MNLSKNIQLLRKKAGISQEELASRLDVSRQAISKWETGETSPEIDKLINISEMFNCSIDTLIKGDITVSNNNDNQIYDSFMNKFSKGISIGVFLILVGLTIMLGIMGFANFNTKDRLFLIAVAVFLIFLIISVPLFIILGIEYDNIHKKYQSLTDIYTDAEIETFNHKFSLTIALSVSIILIGLIILILLYAFNIFKINSTFPVAIFMIFVTISVPFIINAGIQKGKYELISITQYHNYSNNKEIEEKIGKICGVIMLIATIIFFILGFIFKLWEYNWIVFPIGGMICGIVSIIFSKEI